MKKTIIFIALIVTFVSCENFKDKPSKHPHTYECEKPSDIPDTLATGEKVDWDCDWNMAYNDGLVKVKYNADGTPRAVIMYDNE